MKKLFFFLLLFFTLGRQGKTQIIWNDITNEPALARKWPGYTDGFVDTVIDKYRYLGNYRNGERVGPWEVIGLTGAPTSLLLAVYSADSLRFYYRQNSISTYYQLADTRNNRTDAFNVPERAGIVTAVVYNFISRGHNETGSSDWWVSPSNLISTVLDTAIGLKKLALGRFEDREGKTYPEDSVDFKMDGHALDCSFVRLFKDGTYKLMKQRFVIPASTEYTKSADGKLVSVTSTFSVIPPFSHGGKESLLIGSKRNDIIRFSQDLQGNDRIEFESRIDNQPVLKGVTDADGRPDGLWTTYHFSYTNVLGEPGTGAFGGKGLLKTEFTGVKPPGIDYGTGTDFASYLFAAKANTLENTLFNLKGPPVSAGYSDFIEPIWQPFITSAYATKLSAPNDLVLEDKAGYKVFEKLYYQHGILKRAYLYAPNGSLLDSLNWNKDDYGERITNRDGFKPLLPHPLAAQYRQQLNKGIIDLSAAIGKSTTAAWSNVHCAYCNNKVEPSTAVSIYSITCGGATYPHEAVFCSKKCMFEYEKGYCSQH